MPAKLQVVLQNSKRSEEAAPHYYKFASWLHRELLERNITPQMLFFLLDQEVPMYTVWRWLRGETQPNGYQLALLMQRLQKFVEPKILKPLDSKGREVKSVKQSWFPGMGPRK